MPADEWFGDGTPNSILPSKKHTNIGAPETNRTSDLSLRRGLLYPLSYRGVEVDFTGSLPPAYTWLVSTGSLPPMLPSLPRGAPGFAG